MIIWEIDIGKKKNEFRYTLIHSDEFLIDITDRNRNSTYNIVLRLEINSG